eukprot:237174_1
MGNSTSDTNNTDKPQQHDLEPSISNTSNQQIEVHIPFKDLPELFGPYNGYYYHIEDKTLLEKGNTIRCGFRYNAIDYEDIETTPNGDDTTNTDEQNTDNNNNETKQPTQSRYEWIYIDNIAFHKIKQQISLPDKYEKIRAYLSSNDPIPPHFCSKAKMTNIIFTKISSSSLSHNRQLKCRIATKYVGEKSGEKIHHPALLIWRKNEEFCKFNDRPVMLMHLTKVPDKYKDENEKKEGKERIEIQCRPINKYQLERDEWKYDYEIQDLKVEHGLIDIAHWSLKYEMDNNYEYGKYMSNCRRYMVHLCKAFHVKHDAEQWVDQAVELLENVSNVASDSKTWGK